MRLCDPSCPAPRASILPHPGHSRGDNSHSGGWKWEPSRVLSLSPISACISPSSRAPGGVNWSQMGPASHVWHQTWVMSPEECLQLQESVTSMQIRLKMSRYPGTSRYLHNPGNHQSLSSIIKIVSHKQELYYWSEQKSWPCHWMT